MKAQLSPLLPIELLREIISIYIATTTINDADLSGSSQKPDWQLFLPLSIVSKTWRILTLETWFAVLLIRSPEDLLDENLLFPEIKTLWTR